MSGAYRRIKPGSPCEPSVSEEESRLQLYLKRQLEDDIASDAYTECDIKNQEEEIITYLDDNLNELNSHQNKSYGNEATSSEPDVFLTPRSVSSGEKDFKSVSSSPSIEIKKEYYALVPIENNTLEKELRQQDLLSNAFQCMLKSQAGDLSKVNHRNKPTSLSLKTVNTTISVQQSNDTLNQCLNKESAQVDKDCNKNKVIVDNTETLEAKQRIVAYNTNNNTEIFADSSYSPDSLIIDEQSSSSDYLSAVYTSSPEFSSVFLPQIDLNSTKMDNVLNSSDSGLGNIFVLGSINNVLTQTDISLTGRGDDTNNSQIASLTKTTSINLKEQENNCIKANVMPPDEKNKPNEDVATIESSSISSETGSWESAFPPKFADKDICNYFLIKERQYAIEGDNKVYEEQTTVQEPTFKSTSCFIDAASLIDEGEEIIKIQSDEFENDHLSIHTPSQPIQIRPELSPGDCSETNDIDDSLEQGVDLAQQNLPSAAIETIPTFSSPILEHQDNSSGSYNNPEYQRTTSTPYNSILSCKSKNIETAFFNERESQLLTQKKLKYDELCPIISGGASVEDHLPKKDSYQASPVTRRKIENMPIVSGAYTPFEEISRKSPKHSNVAAWVVDMSNNMKVHGEKNNVSINKPKDKTCANLANESKHSSSPESCTKSRSSINSDSSERSSHKFYIDLSNLPDPLPLKTETEQESDKKKNIFSMYIDFNNESQLKPMPARLSSSFNSKKTCEFKSEHKSSKLEIENVNSIDSTFEKIESLCNDPSIQISEIIENQVFKNKGVNEEKNKATIEEKFPNGENACATDVFVKLSDLDKVNATFDLDDQGPANARMTRSIPDNDWKEPGHNYASRSVEFYQSFHSENEVCLNRLFPNLKNELISRSMPVSLSYRTKSPISASQTGDTTEQASCLSEVSSVRSSICRSGIDESSSNDFLKMSSLIGHCQSRLGDDLLKMFIEEIAPDVIVEAAGRRIKAHKCVLASRCQYFAAMLSGGWVESAGNVIAIPSFSFNVVYFALCHIYSGASTIPDAVSIVELATLSDMLGLEGLKEVIMFTLKKDYCHNFHEPCSVCIAGVLECFPLSSAYNLDYLYQKCLCWITKHFAIVWPTKMFATLPKELLEKCYQQHVVHMSLNNFVDIIFGCGNIVSSLRRSSSWTVKVTRLCQRLLNASSHFVSPRLTPAMQKLSQIMNDATPSALKALDDCIVSAIECASPEEVCRSYAYLIESVVDSEQKHNSFTSEANSSILSTHSNAWRFKCENALVRAAPRVVVTQAFKDLPAHLRKKLRELGCIMYGTQVNSSSLTFKEPSANRRSKSHNLTASPLMSIDRMRTSFVPYVAAPVVKKSPARATDTQKRSDDTQKRSDYTQRPKKKNDSTAPLVRTTKAQQEREKFNLQKKCVGPTVPATSRTRPNVSYLHTKPRYLEPRVCKEDEQKPAAARKPFPKMVSSSESSRNSSPIQARYLRSTYNAKSSHLSDARRGHAMSQDSLATSSRPRTAEPSTDSLSESLNSNKYATYTKHQRPTLMSNYAPKVPVGSQPSQTVSNNKFKTKIPVLQIQNDKRSSRVLNRSPDTKPKNTSNVVTNNSRIVLGSLMKATKSSSAKIVTKINGDRKIKGDSVQSKGKTRAINKTEECPLSPVPVMERSGTFLKDEPMFGETTNLSIDS